MKFVAKAGRANRRQVICNVYANGKWDRVEHYHLDCYNNAGEPYGPAEEANFRPQLPRR